MINQPAQFMAPVRPPRVKCLLVDDRAENLLALSALLRQDDVELLEARSGTEALELLLLHDMALALIDVQMPLMDGFELAELMRGSERTRHVPIIFITAGAHDQQRIFRGYDHGAVDFLYKPVEPQILRSKADVFFQLYRQKQQLAQQLRERTDMLRLNETFSAMLGHDLRAPLTAIVMTAQVMARRPGDDPWAAKTAARLLESGLRMNRMIDDLLDLSRARLGGGFSLARRPVDLVELIERVCEERQAGGASGGEVAVVAEGDLEGEWDADRLAQIVSNLLGNALSHGDRSVPVEIRVDGGAPHAVSLSVSNGGAIAPDVARHVFEPFRSGRQHARRTEGLGLGLYIVQQIVRAHGGTIELDASVPERTRFVVMLPRRDGLSL